jgi:hypothetical protein
MNEIGLYFKYLTFQMTENSVLSLYYLEKANLRNSFISQYVDNNYLNNN